MFTNKSFTNYISLGSRCYIALDLIYFHQRIKSYPFDWLISDYKFILYTFKNGKFPDVFKEDKLYQDNVSRFKYFTNEEGGAWFIHDFDDYIPLRYQLKNTAKKFKRRTKRFFKDIKNDTLFIRFCETQEEVNFIEKNYNIIVNYLKKFNFRNEILFIINPYLYTESPIFYKTNWAENEEGKIDRIALRHVDAFYLNNFFSLLPPKKLKKNLLTKCREFNTRFKYYVLHKKYKAKYIHNLEIDPVNFH